MAAAGPSSAVASNEQHDNWHKLVTVGHLPDDFLRIVSTEEQLQQEADEQTALALQNQYVTSSVYQQNTAARLSITIVEAKLKKNYGMTRMDPYVRFRVGHFIYETETHSNGGKNPTWNKSIQCHLPKGVTSIYVEIFDECVFVIDEKIAWAHVSIPTKVFEGETIDDWYPLSGRLGEGIEGAIHLVLTCSKGYHLPVQQNIPAMLELQSTNGSHKSTMVYQQQSQPQHQLEIPHQTPSLEDEHDLKQIEDMFPNIDKETIKVVTRSNQNNKEAIINSLLQMSE